MSELWGRLWGETGVDQLARGGFFTIRALTWNGITFITVVLFERFGTVAKFKSGVMG
jgi:hypothetical protein